MDREIFDTYQISFIEKFNPNRNRIRKKCLGGGVANFLDDLTYPSDIDEMIKDIDFFLQNRSNFSIEVTDVLHSDGAFSAWLVDEQANIYASFTNGSSDMKLQSIPLSDFKIVLRAWKEFLES